MAHGISCEKNRGKIERNRRKELFVLHLCVKCLWNGMECDGDLKTLIKNFRLIPTSLIYLFIILRQTTLHLIANQSNKMPQNKELGTFVECMLSNQTILQNFVHCQPTTNLHQFLTFLQHKSTSKRTMLVTM